MEFRVLVQSVFCCVQAMMAVSSAFWVDSLHRLEGDHLASCWMYMLAFSNDFDLREGSLGCWFDSAGDPSEASAVGQLPVYVFDGGVRVCVFGRHSLC
jgi:hypothetical protein